MGNNFTQPRRRGFLKADSVKLSSDPVVIASDNKHCDFGKLTVKRENGVVKGFEYQCVCGQREYFVCE